MAMKQELQNAERTKTVTEMAMSPTMMMFGFGFGFGFGDGYGDDVWCLVLVRSCEFRWTQGVSRAAYRRSLQETRRDPPVLFYVE